MYKYDPLVIIVYTYILFLFFFFRLQRAIYLKTYCMNLIGISPHPRFLVLIKLKFQTFIAEKMDKNMDM